MTAIKVSNHQEIDYADGVAFTGKDYIFTDFGGVCHALINPRTRRILKTLSYAKALEGAVFDGRNLWVGAAISGTYYLKMFNFRTGTEIKSHTIGSDKLMGLTSNGRLLYTSDLDNGPIKAINPRTGTETDSFTSDGDGTNDRQGKTFDGRALIVGFGQAGKFSQLNPRTGHELRPYCNNSHHRGMGWDGRCVLSGEFLSFGSGIALTEDLDDSETGVDVASGAAFRLGWYVWVQNSSEVMKIISITGNTLTVVRGVLGTAATAHTSGEKVSKALILVQESFNYPRTSPP